MTQGSLRQRIVEDALSLPGAYEDFPWGERVTKVNKKIFVFLGADDVKVTDMTVKLPDSCDFGLSFETVTPSSYGLARTGWIHVDFDHVDCSSIGVLLDWLDESYRSIALKRLIAELDENEK